LASNKFFNIPAFFEDYNMGKCMNLPGGMEEQSLIAQIHSDIDIEIEQ
jgi:hypothetical protein